MEKSWDQDSDPHNNIVDADRQDWFLSENFHGNNIYLLGNLYSVYSSWYSSIENQHHIYFKCSGGAYEYVQGTNNLVTL